MPKEPALLLADLKFGWRGREAFELKVDHFHVDAGEKVLLLGRSGSGKTTLLSLTGGIISPQQGRILVAGTDFAKLTGNKRDRHRAEAIGVIFQQFNLLPYASVADNIALSLRFAPKRRHAVGNIERETSRLCSALALPPDVLRCNAGRLSVGQQQRVAVARALIGTPPLILADEPTSALDSHSQHKFLELLFAQISSAGSALLMVSHDEQLAAQFDRVVRMEQVVFRGESSPC